MTPGRRPGGLDTWKDYREGSWSGPAGRRAPISAAWGDPAGRRRMDVPPAPRGREPFCRSLQLEGGSRRDAAGSPSAIAAGTRLRGTWMSSARGRSVASPDGGLFPSRLSLTRPSIRERCCLGSSSFAQVSIKTKEGGQEAGVWCHWGEPPTRGQTNEGVFCYINPFLAPARILPPKHGTRRALLRGAAAALPAGSGLGPDRGHGRLGADRGRGWLWGCFVSCRAPICIYANKSHSPH